MRTNVDINEKDLKEAMEYLGVSTKKEALNLALKEVLRKKANQQMIESAGTGWGWPGDEEENLSSEEDTRNAD